MNKQKLFKTLKRNWEKKVEIRLKHLIILSSVFMIGIAGILLLFFRMSNQSNPSWQQVSGAYFDPIDVIKSNRQIQLVDIRAAEDFREGHMKGAVNIPVEFEKGNINNKEDMLRRFSELKSEPEIVLYGENSYTLQTARTAEFLERENIRVKILRIGWTEFFHFQTFWIPEKLSSTINILDYIELPE